MKNAEQTFKDEVQKIVNNLLDIETDLIIGHINKLINERIKYIDRRKLMSPSNHELQTSFEMVVNELSSLRSIINNYSQTIKEKNEKLRL